MVLVGGVVVDVTVLSGVVLGTDGVGGRSEELLVLAAVDVDVVLVLGVDVED